jgi:hypothetical protein
MDDIQQLFYPAVMHSLVIRPEQEGSGFNRRKLLIILVKSKLLCNQSVTNNNSKLYI